MVIAACTLQLQLYGIHSLKDKRSVIKYIVKRLPRQFSVAIAEVEDQDVWTSSILGIVAVGNDSRHLHSMMEKAVAWVETNRPDVEIVDYSIEFR